MGLLRRIWIVPSTSTSTLTAATADADHHWPDVRFNLGPTASRASHDRTSPAIGGERGVTERYES